jgi:hypothetical protein
LARIELGRIYQLRFNNSERRGLFRGEKWLPFDLCHHFGWAHLRDSGNRSVVGLVSIIDLRMCSFVSVEMVNTAVGSFSVFAGDAAIGKVSAPRADDLVCGLECEVDIMSSPPADALHIFFDYDRRNIFWERNFGVSEHPSEIVC